MPSTPSTDRCTTRFRSCAGASSSPTTPIEWRALVDARVSAPSCARLEQRCLPRLRRRPAELREVEFETHAVETQLRTGLVEALADHLRPDAGAGHARAEARVVVFAASHLAHPSHHALGLVGDVLLQPL